MALMANARGLGMALKIKKYSACASTLGVRKFLSPSFLRCSQNEYTGDAGLSGNMISRYQITPSPQRDFNGRHTSGLRNTSTSQLNHCRYHHRLCHTSAKEEEVIEGEKVEDGNITEKDQGPSSTHEFQAETRMLLDIVAKSLYSDKEVFVRELISNASDALEKLRYLHLSETSNSPTTELPESERQREISIYTDKDKKTFTIHDTGVGLTKQEMIDNLGTIAKSGAKSFLKELKEKGMLEDEASKIIGQFGVGFYSTFMVADRVDVFSKTNYPASDLNKETKGYHWTSDGSGKYQISEAEGVASGTKVILHLKSDCSEFSTEDKIEEIVKKHSNFVNFPIIVNGRKINTIQAIWTLDSRDVTEEMHTEFYRFVSHLYDAPRYTLNYKADAPLAIKAIFYVPESKPGMFERSQFSDSGIQLYARKVLIQSKSDILPKYLRFVRGVVDSDDIPLNLSRELLQDSTIIRRLRTVLTNRLLRFFQDQARKDRVKFEKFAAEYALFFHEGIVTSPEQRDREEIAKLLRFESSKLKASQTLGLADYVGKMSASQRDIWYLAAPSRALAESSPYLEALSSSHKSEEKSGKEEETSPITGQSDDSDVEILFCYGMYDELALTQLGEFAGHKLKSAESVVRSGGDKKGKEGDKESEHSLDKAAANDLCTWIKRKLAYRVNEVTVTTSLHSHPCMITVEEMGAARHFVRNEFASLAEETRYGLLQPTLLLNPSHELIKKLSSIRTTDEALAVMCVEQLYDNAMAMAGLVDDARPLVGRMNQLLTLALAKH